MSCRFEVRVGRPLEWARLLEAVASPDLRHRESGELILCWRHGVSTRTVEVTLAGDRLEVRVFVLSAPEDVDLAFRLLEATGAETVKAELLGELPIDQLRGVCGAGWVEELARSGTRVLKTLISEQGPMGMPGPVRTSWIGPRVLAELAAGGPADELHLRVRDLMRRVQWIDDSAHPAAGIFEAQVGERRRTLAVWSGRAALFPGVDYAIVAAGERDVFLIPAPRVPELAGERWHWLDERQGFIDDFGPDWPALVARARALQVSAAT